MGTRTRLRPLQGLIFAALVALSLWMSTADALARTRGFTRLPNIFDPGIVEGDNFVPRPIGHLGVTWE